MVLLAVVTTDKPKSATPGARDGTRETEKVSGEW